MQEDGMQRVLKKLVATMLAAVTIAAPATALAEEDDGKCRSYEQVNSSSTGGDYVGGILFYETMATVTRSEPTTTTTTTTSVTAGIPGTGAGGSTTTTTTQPGATTATQEPVGYYSMNDGSIWTINCVTDEEKKITNG
jgi:hypothetical protein